MLVLLVAACQGAPIDDEDDETVEADVDVDVDQGEEGVEQAGHLVIAHPGFGSELWATHLADGLDAVVPALWGDHLLRADPATREYEPGLAESWEMSDDGLTWTFRLRPDVPFHDGYGTVTTEDVRFTWELWLRDETLRGRATVIRSAVDNDIENFEIVNDLEFRLHASSPTAVFLDQLHQGNEGLVVQSKAHYDDVGEEEAFRRPVGSGPFRFVEHEPGVRLLFEAVEDHWRQSPHFETLELRVIEDEAARLAQVRTGEVDLAPISLTTVPEAEAAGLRLIEIPDVGLSSINFGGFYPGDPEAFDRDAPYSQADAPERGRAIREALLIAVDRESIVENIQSGQGAPAVGPGVAFMPGDYAFTSPEWEVPEYNPERARELLQEGGYPDGFEVDLLMYEQSGRPGVQDIAEAVAGMWEEIGITVNRVPVEYSTSVGPDVEERTSAGYLYQHAQGFADEPAERFFNTLSTGGRIAHFYHPAIEEALPLLEAELDRERRFEIAQEVGDALMQDVWTIPLVSISNTYVIGDAIESWEFTNGLGTLSSLETITPRAP